MSEPAGEEATDLDETEVAPGEELEEIEEVASGTTPTRTEDLQLSIENAEPIAGRRGMTVTLVAGEANTGKTSLLTGVWRQCLQTGGVGKLRFAGTWTALGFERRAWLTRAAAKQDASTTLRTFQEDNGFLHLRLADGTDLHELLLSDVAGETFKNIRKGATFGQALKWAGRTDNAVVLVSGAAVNNNATRSTALAHTRTLLKQLRRLEPAPRVAVALTMSDMLDEYGRARWDAEKVALVELAKAVHADAQLFETAAQPQSGESPEGLDRLVEWLTQPKDASAQVEADPVEQQRPERTAGRVR